MRVKKILGIAVVATLMLVTIAGAYGAYRFYRRFNVPSASMWPLFPVGSKFSVNTFERTSERGGVVVYRSPQHPSELFTKRIVGVAGDRIEERADGTVFINGWPVPRCAAGPATLASDDGPHRGELFVEHLGKASYVVFFDAVAPASPGAWTVAPGTFFAAGDNRRNSFDSRIGGNIPEANIVGRARVEMDPSRLAGIAASAAAVRACLAGKPAVTDPPGSK